MWPRRPSPNRRTNRRENLEICWSAAAQRGTAQYTFRDEPGPHKDLSVVAARAQNGGRDPAQGEGPEDHIEISPERGRRIDPGEQREELRVQVTVVHVGQREEPERLVSGRPGHHGRRP